MSGNLQDRKYEGLCNIADYLWETNPEKFIELQNAFNRKKVKIVKEDSKVKK